MGTISTTKLAGFSIALGPVIAVIFYFLQPGIALIDQADPADATAVINALTANSGLTTLTGILISVGLVILVYGIFFIAGEIRGNGNGDALVRYAVPMILIGLVGFIFGNGIIVSIGSDVGTSAAPLFHVGSGIAGIAGIFFSLGFLAFFLALACREEYNSTLAYIVSVVSVITVVVSIIGFSDNSQLEWTSGVNGIGYVIFTIYSIILGKDLISREE